MKKIATVTLGAGLLASSAFGKVNFELFIEAITQQDSATVISDSGLVVLVVDTGGDGFQMPTNGSFVTGNDEIVANWDLASYAFDSSDITLLANGISWGSNWSKGDDLALFWFPTLSGSDVPGADTPFGVFSDGAGLASGDGWSMPGDESFHTLTLITEAATKLAMVADLPSAIGAAAFAVNNLPSSTPPASPSVDVMPDGTKNVLSWTSSDTPSGGFLVQRSKSGGAWETIGFASSGDTTFEDGDVKPGRQYDYRLYSLSALAYSEGNDIPVVTAERSKFINLAARGHIVPGSSNRDWTLMNAGIVMTGTDQFKRVLALGIGPYNLDRLNQPWLEDTRMVYEVVNAGVGQTVVENRNWMRDEDNVATNPDLEALENAMTYRGTPMLPTEGETGKPNSGKDSAIITDIANIKNGTSNIFKVFSADDTADPGFVGIQVYDAEYEGGDNPDIHDNRIINLSTKGYLAEGATSVFNASMVIDGNVPKEVLVLARGPALTLKGVAGALENPKLILKRGNDVLATNDDWDGATDVTSLAESRGLLAVETDLNRIRAAITAAGQNPDDHTLDSAMLVTLAPGLSEGYVFKVEAADGSTSTDGTVQVQVNEMEID